MPKALGEYGKGKHSAVTQKVMVALESTILSYESTRDMETSTSGFR